VDVVQPMAISLPDVAETERTRQQGPEPDLHARIAANVHQRRHGRHAHPRGSRHLARKTERASQHVPAAIRFALLIVTTVVLVLVLRTFVVASFYIPSESMEPTLHGCRTCEADRVVVDKLSYLFGAIGRKDVVVFRKPPRLDVNDKDLIKRVIGLPGESISAHDGKVYVNGQALDEPYVMPSCGGTADFAAVTVPRNEYFVMGDNRCNSYDSRRFGAIDRSLIVGRAFALVWPLKHLRWL
jgi:signal peptidase I